MFQVDEDAGIAVLTMAHGKVNALDVEVLEGLVDELAGLERSEAGAVILTGAGRAFSAGVDLFRVLEGGPAYVDRLVPALAGAFEALFRFPKPVVAAINGAAIAGGCVMACACDRRITGPDAPIGASELRVGVPLPVAALEILRSSCGDHAAEVILSAGLFRGPEAVARGLADEVVAPSLVLDRALEVAGDLATLSAPAYRMAKAQLRAPALERIAAGARADEEVRALWSSPATTTAIEGSLAQTVGRR